MARIRQRGGGEHVSPGRERPGLQFADLVIGQRPIETPGDHPVPFYVAAHRIGPASRYTCSDWYRDYLQKDGGACETS